MTETARAGRSTKMTAAAVVIGLLGSGALVWQASSAAFTATTENPGNSWQSGKVILSDNDSDIALFAETGLFPQATGTNCIEVRYDGTVASSVRLYAQNLTGTLGMYLDFDVELGSGASCAAPGTYTRIFGDAAVGLDGSDTVAYFAGAHTDFGNGVGTWNPSTINTIRPYRITWTMGDDNDAQDESAGVQLVWEAQSN